MRVLKLFENEAARHYGFEKPAVQNTVSLSDRVGALVVGKFWAVVGVGSTIQKAVATFLQGCFEDDVGFQRDAKIEAAAQALIKNIPDDAQAQLKFFAERLKLNTAIINTKNQWIEMPSAKRQELTLDLAYLTLEREAESKQCW